MVCITLWTRLSSLWRSDTADGSEAEPETNENSPDESTHETLSYAEEIEYGADERDICDEDRILRLLVKRGGRVDESTVLEETGWSQKRLEALIDEMETEKQISAITIGRKRVICRRGFEPKGYRSHINE